MINKKNIITAALLGALIIGIDVAQANSANNLTQVDVRKSAAADAIDVTFYTTGDSNNSVVTRKSNNRYVILLPNVSGVGTAAPGIGGVKDLVTNVNVKNVDDGIGGYTKITFETTKPINIRTYMKKSSPLTQAQKDYKALIAQNNNVKPVSHVSSQDSAKKVEQPKPKAQEHTTPAVQKQNTTVQPQNNKPAQSKTIEKTTPKISFTPISVPKVKSEPVKPKVEPKKIKTETPKPTVQNNVQPKATEQVDNYVPKMKFDEQGKRQIDLEPRVVHDIVKENPTPVVNLNEKNTPVVADSNSEKTEPQDKKSSTPNHLPIWLMAGSGVLLFLLMKEILKKSIKHTPETPSFFDLSEKNKRRMVKREYQNIMNAEGLNWQERFKTYTEKDNQINQKPQTKDVSYVTDLSGTKKAIIEPKIESQKPVNKQKMVSNNTVVPKPASTKNLKTVLDSINNIPENKEANINSKLQAKISQMEHALSQTPSLEPPADVMNALMSEDDAIMNSINNVKLKSFGKSLNLKETNRNIISTKKSSQKMEEGKFVKLKNSPLSVTKRNSNNSNAEMPDLLKAITENKYLTNNGEMKMEKQNENYLLSSLDEYLSILDSEQEKSSMIADTLSQVGTSANANRSGATNPISRASNPMLKSNSSDYANGVIVKSGYNIDDNKGFYLVNIDGVSALVGRNNNDTVILKKFDYIVNKPIQVRHDYGSVYIVKVDGFKCLVDVSKEKMGTLVEI